MRPLIAGNWKMHGLARQLDAIAAIARAVERAPPEADVLICPPATLLSRAADTAAGRIAIGGQDCHPGSTGAFTGDVSAEMLVDAGARSVIVGHSERRTHHGEHDALVAEKVRAAAQAGLRVIVCIGETLAQRQAGQALSVCSAQLAGSLPAGVTLADAAIGYEPLWAIGTGHTPTHAQITEVHAHIRRCLVARPGGDGARVRVLYGGSVTPANAREILALPDVDGALVGGASLDAADFEAIIRAVPARP